MLVTNLENMYPPELEKYLSQIDGLLKEEKEKKEDEENKEKEKLENE